MAETNATLEDFFHEFYRTDSKLTYDSVAKFLKTEDVNVEHFDKHFLIHENDQKAFLDVVHELSSNLYSPRIGDTSIFREYNPLDVTIMKEGSTRPIRIRIAHPELVQEVQLHKTFYVKKNLDAYTRLIGTFLYHIFNLTPFNLWVNDKIIVISETRGTVASRLPPGRLDHLLTKKYFVMEMIRSNVLIKSMFLTDMYPKNYIVRISTDRHGHSNWDVVAIDFDHAFLPANIAEATLIVPDYNKPLEPWNNKLSLAIKEHFSEHAVKVFERQEEERLAEIYTLQYQRLNLLFDILSKRLYSKSIYRDLSKEFVETFQFGKESATLGHLLRNSFEYLLQRMK